MRKKAAELRIKEIQSKASTDSITHDRLRELAKKHGVILALTPELKGDIRELQEKYNIPSSKIITEQIIEEDVLRKFSKVDVEKLGLLAYQRVLMHKEETGGIMPIQEVFEFVNTGILKGKVDIDDLLKAMKYLKKKSVIEDVRLLESGSILIHFFPIQYTSDQAKVVELAKEKGYITLEDVCVSLEWSQDRALRSLKSLEDSGVAKYRDSILKKAWYFPSLE